MVLCPAASCSAGPRLGGASLKGRRLNEVAASLRQGPSLTQEAWAFAHPSDQTRRSWFALFTYLRRVNERFDCLGNGQQSRWLRVPPTALL